MGISIVSYKSEVSTGYRARRAERSVSLSTFYFHSYHTLSTAGRRTPRAVLPYTSSSLSLGTVYGYGHPIAMHTTVTAVATIVRHARCLDRAQSRRTSHTRRPRACARHSLYPPHPFRSRVASPLMKRAPMHSGAHHHTHASPLPPASDPQSALPRFHHHTARLIDAGMAHLKLAFELCQVRRTATA
jgi:hypothetical protein